MSENNNTIIQTVDGISFRMEREFDFSFLKKYGRVFKVFDDQDSGNVCFGIEGADGRLFVKFAGAPAARHVISIPEVVANLKATVSIYETIRHPNLIEYRYSEEIGGGFAMIFRWAEGDCMARMYPESHRKIMALPLDKKLSVFADIAAFLTDVHRLGYVAVDFYDGSVMYDSTTGKTTICDIDLFRKKPAVNDMGRMWGSERFLSPEEYQSGAAIDEITNVFTLGQMAFSLFTDSDHTSEAWPLSQNSFDVVSRAISPKREHRYQSINEFYEKWVKSMPV